MMYIFLIEFLIQVLFNVLYMRSTENRSAQNVYFTDCCTYTSKYNKHKDIFLEIFSNCAEKEHFAIWIFMTFWCRKLLLTHSSFFMFQIYIFKTSFKFLLYFHFMESINNISRFSRIISF